jgi:two-component system, chemotaxis family, response regulator Rcp1
MKYKKNFDILIVEDNPADVYLIRECMSDKGIIPHLHIVNDGDEALRFLERKAPFADKPMPKLVILDLNLPKISGFQVLEFIKKDNRFKSIPVIILSTSSSSNDIAQSYSLNANCYVVKPKDLEDFSRIVSSIEDFWMETAEVA